MTDTTTIQAKIAALLAKAEATDFPAEAEAFTAKASALMVKWGIDEAMLAAKRAGTNQAEKIIEVKMEFGSIYSMGLQAFASNIASGMGLRTLVSRHWDKSKRHTRYVHLIGFEGDVARAEMLITSLQLQMTTALRQWWTTFEDKSWMMPAQQVNAKRSFMESFGSAVRVRLLATRREQEAATQTQGGTSVALVLRSREDEVNDYINSNYRVGRAKGMKGSSAGRAEGRAAGQRADIGGTRVGNGTRGAIG